MFQDFLFLWMAAGLFGFTKDRFFWMQKLNFVSDNSLKYCLFIYIKNHIPSLEYGIFTFGARDRTRTGMNYSFEGF